MSERGRAAHGGRGGRATLISIAAIMFAPIAIAAIVYYLFPRPAATNYGELLETRPIGAIEGRGPNGEAFRLADYRGLWVILFAAPGSCDRRCERALYATRQARTMQGAEMERVVRVWLVSDEAAPAATLLAQHPGLVAPHVGASRLDALPHGGQAIVLVDPLGNQVLAWPPDPDIKALARDLSRVLRASRIG